MTSGANAPSTIASIVTWNHAHCIAACIESLLRQTVPLDSIFVYDNASTDGTREALEKFRTRATLFYSPENRGFCGGHNFALSRTESEFVLLVNPDVVLQPDYLQKAIQRMSTHHKIGTVCGLLLQGGSDSKCSRIDGAGLTVAQNRRFLLRYHGVLASEVSLRPEEVFGSDGALPFYRRSMIKDVSFDGQFFDEMFFAHKEDHDVSWRSQIFGWKTFFDPECVATHPRVFRPGNLKLRKQLPPEIRYHAVKNDLLLLLKNESPPNFARDFIRIFPRRFGIMLFALFREPYSLNAYWFIMRNWRRIMNARQRIRERGTASSREIRRRFTLGAS